MRPINFGAVLPSGVCRTTNPVALLAAQQQEEHLHAHRDNISATTTVLPMAVHAMVIHIILRVPLEQQDSQLLTRNLRKIVASAKNTMEQNASTRKREHRIRYAAPERIATDMADA